MAKLRRRKPSVTSRRGPGRPRRNTATTPTLTAPAQPSPISPTPVVPPGAPPATTHLSTTFHLSPYLAQTLIIDYSTKGGMKLYDDSIKPLAKEPFDCDTTSLRPLIAALRNRATITGWHNPGGILWFNLDEKKRLFSIFTAFSTSKPLKWWRQITSPRRPYLLKKQTYSTTTSLTPFQVMPSTN